MIVLWRRIQTKITGRLDKRCMDDVREVVRGRRMRVIRDREGWQNMEEAYVRQLMSSGGGNRKRKSFFQIYTPPPIGSFAKYLKSPILKGWNCCKKPFLPILPFQPRFTSSLDRYWKNLIHLSLKFKMYSNQNRFAFEIIILHLKDNVKNLMCNYRWNQDLLTTPMFW